MGDPIGDIEKLVAAQEPGNAEWKRPAPDDVDPFIEEMLEYMISRPNHGDRISVNGRPGIFVGHAPQAATCQVTYIVDFDDGERANVWLGDWDPNRPEIVVLERAPLTE